jgi:hypothetical protein
MTPTTMPMRIALKMPVMVISPPTDRRLGLKYPGCARIKARVNQDVRHERFVSVSIEAGSNFRKYILTS